MKITVTGPRVHVFDFDERLAMSRGTTFGDVHDVLLSAVPDAIAVRTATESEDRAGTDHWVACQNGDTLSVDVKVRELDPIVEFGMDDLALETWSVVGKRRGWTLDPLKRHDYVLWWWQPTGRWCLVPTPLLRAVFTEHLDEWTAAYPLAKQETRGRTSWFSECVFVPRVVVWRAIYERFGGKPVAP